MRVGRGKFAGGAFFTAGVTFLTIFAGFGEELTVT
jgi:hypothetical protein